MISVKAKLSAKYLYVRCDGEFSLNFTNGSSMPFWKGFYCLLTEDLQKYNTNNELEIVSDDDSLVWWLSSDTLIMNVTDINTDLLDVMAQSNLANLNANSLQNNYLDNVVRLLMSIQNSFSTFLNSYIESNSVENYGFQECSIGSNGVANLYIGKPSSTNKYTFNSKISYYGNISGTVPTANDYGIHVSTLSSLSGLYLTWEADGKLHLHRPDKSILFNVFDNNSELLTGYTVSNVSVTSSFSVSGSMWGMGSPSMGVGSVGSVVTSYGDASYSGALFTSASYSSKFDCVGSSEMLYSFDSFKQSPTSITGFERIDIVFDVAKV